LIASGEDGVTYAPLSQYEIVVLTGDRYGAGTNSNVTMQLYGEKGDTGRLPLNNSYHFCLLKKFRKLIFFIYLLVLIISNVIREMFSNMNVEILANWLNYQLNMKIR